MMRYLQMMIISILPILSLLSGVSQVRAQGPTFYGIGLNYDITYYGTQPYPSVTCGPGHWQILGLNEFQSS